MSNFPEINFKESLEELEEPKINDFELFVECSGVQIHRKFLPESSLYEYKVLGELKSDVQTFVKVYMDLEYRKSWDSYVKELYEKEDEHEGSFIYWNVNYPFPLANRDYTYIRECREMTEETTNKTPTWVILSESKQISSCPDKSGVVRVNDYKQNLSIQHKDENTTKLFMHYKDNPGGSIPTWLINWAAKKGVPSFLTEMKKASDGYPKYLEKKKKGKK
ncbi:phosphatidylcholine transfer protein-like [Clytia hemisphaerica]|uniref:Phosphatidylcholine transfer protein n=1 Tax=Clytia hemisphaerica TaxID=252671 RepID=A0A7M5V7V0_9CNID